MDGREVTLRADDRLLILAPHPDDETLAAGGLLQHASAAGAAIFVILASDGENNPWVQRVAERRVFIGPKEKQRFGQRRWGEFREALACLVGLGVSPLRLGIPDQGVTALLMNDAAGLVDRLHEQLVIHRPTIVVIPSVRDRHPDHNALAVAARIALMRLVPEQQPRLVLSFLIHAPSLTALDIPRAVVKLAPSQRERKREAISMHASQMSCHRRHFQKIADANENFLIGETAAQDAIGHPVQARIEDNRLCLSVRSSRWAFGARRANLWLLCVTGGAPTGGVRVALGERHEKIFIQQWPNGAVIEQAKCQAIGGELKFVIDLQLLGEPDHVYIKFNRKLLMFDSSGWRDVLVSRAASCPKEAALAQT